MTELEELIQRIERKYKVETTPLKLAGKELNILQFTDFEAYIEELIEGSDAGAEDLPYWAKIWESSFLLAYFIGKQPVVPWQRMLEIGSSMGVVGVYAALCGHKVTITDTNEDALLFARANVLLNGANAEVQKLDWNRPDVTPYEVIFGSEIVYDRSSYPLMVGFLRKALAPNGTFFLAKSTSMHAPAFFEELTKYFKFKKTVQKVRSCGETLEVSLFAIRHKDDPRT